MNIQNLRRFHVNIQNLQRSLQNICKDPVHQRVGDTEHYHTDNTLYNLVDDLSVLRITKRKYALGKTINILPFPTLVYERIGICLK